MSLFLVLCCVSLQFFERLLSNEASCLMTVTEPSQTVPWQENKYVKDYMRRHWTMTMVCLFSEHPRKNDFLLHCGRQYFMMPTLHGQGTSTNRWWHLLERFLQNGLYKKKHIGGNQGCLEPDFSPAMHLMSCTSLQTQYMLGRKCYHLEGWCKL